MEYLHKLNGKEFRILLCERFGKDSRAEAAYDYLCNNMNAKNGYARWNGEDYFIHPQAVAEILLYNTDIGEDGIIVALLHDCIEDMPLGTDSEILELFGKEIVRKTLLVTKKPNLDYHIDSNMQEYMSAIIEDSDATLVKVSDRLNNNSTIIGKNEEYKNKKTLETRKFFLPMAIEGEKRYPQYTDFFKKAAEFFDKPIV